MYPKFTVNRYPFYEAASALQKEIRRGKEFEAMYWALELAESYADFLWYRLVIIANEDVGLADPSVIVLIEALRNQFHFVRTKKAQWRIVLANAILALCRAKKTRLADDFTATVSHQRDSEGLVLTVPDYALDRHTARGASIGRGFEHWAREGCKLENEVEGLNIYSLAAFSLRKKHGKIKNQGKPGGGNSRKRAQIEAGAQIKWPW